MLSRRGAGWLAKTPSMRGRIRRLEIFSIVRDIYKFKFSN